MFLQAWGVMEVRLGRSGAAQRAFEAGTRACAPHAPLLSAWARMEVGSICPLSDLGRVALQILHLKRSVFCTAKSHGLLDRLMEPKLLVVRKLTSELHDSLRVFRCMMSQAASLAPSPKAEIACCTAHCHSRSPQPSPGVARAVHFVHPHSSAHGVFRRAGKGLLPLTQAKRQRVTAARQLWRKALAADPGHLPSLLGLAGLEARSGNHDRAQA